MTSLVVLTSKRNCSLQLVEDCIKFSEMGFREIFWGAVDLGFEEEV
jgi:hypothetical protein